MKARSRGLLLRPIFKDGRLIAYAAKALSDTRLPIRDDVVTGLAVPLVALLVFSATRRVRRRMEREDT